MSSIILSICLIRISIVTFVKRKGSYLLVLISFMLLRPALKVLVFMMAGLLISVGLLPLILNRFPSLTRPLWKLAFFQFCCHFRVLTYLPFLLFLIWLSMPLNLFPVKKLWSLMGYLLNTLLVVQFYLWRRC